MLTEEKKSTSTRRSARIDRVGLWAIPTIQVAIFVTEGSTLCHLEEFTLFHDLEEKPFIHLESNPNLTREQLNTALWQAQLTQLLADRIVKRGRWAPINEHAEAIGPSLLIRNEDRETTPDVITDGLVLYLFVSTDSHLPRVGSHDRAEMLRHDRSCIERINSQVCV